VPEEAATVTVSVLAPEVVGLKEMVPVVQEAPLARVELAVQVPSPTVKSVESELLNGVALNTTGPPEAVKVIEPVQVLVEPAFTDGQVAEPEAAKLPAAPVPESAKLVPVPSPLVVATVTVSVLAPVVVGLKVIVPVVQVAPEAIARLAVQVPSGVVKSVPSELVSGVAPNTTGPWAVNVIVPVLQVAESPAPTLPQVKDAGLAAIAP
jgi:hypothetical protein